MTHDFSSSLIIPSFLDLEIISVLLKSTKSAALNSSAMLLMVSFNSYSKESTIYKTLVISYFSKTSDKINCSTTFKVLATPVDSIITGSFVFAYLFRISTNSVPVLQQIHPPAIVSMSCACSFKTLESILLEANSFSITRTFLKSGCFNKN